MKRLVIFLIALCTAFLPALCSAEGEDTGGGTAVELPEELRVPKGAIKLGETVDTAIAKMGQPVRIVNNENYCWRSRINLYGPELVIRTLPNKEIYGFYVRKWSPAKTPEGIGVGSTKEAVKAVYGKGLEFKRKDIMLSYGSSVPGERYLRFGISAKTNKVEYFWMGINQKR